MAGYIGKIQIDTGNPLLIGSTLYGVCSTAAATAAKTVTLADLNTAPVPGLTVHIKFTNGNTATSSVTLAIGNQSAVTVEGTFICEAGAVIAFTFEDISNTKYWRVNNPVSIAEGSTNGAITYNGQTINVHGLGTAAYTASTAYATSDHSHTTEYDSRYVKIDGGGTLSSGTIYIGASSTGNDTEVATKQYVENAFANAMGIATSAMVFKGTIGTASGATLSELPSNGYVAGWTYRVVGGYTFGTSPNEIVCEDGDIIIAVTSRATGSSITPSDWTVAQANIDGAVVTNGTTSNNHLALFNGSNTITNGPEILSTAISTQTQSTLFLRQDGTWAAPSYTTNFVTKLIAGGASATSNAAVTSGNVYLRLFDDSTHRNDIQLHGDTGIKITSSNAGVVTIEHSHTDITAKTAAAQSAKTLTWSGTFTIYEEKYDAQGHITGVASYNMTMPANPNTDVAVAQTGTSTNAEYPILFKYDTGTTDVTANYVQFGKTSGKLVTINPSTGIITAAGFSGTLSTSNLSGIDSNDATYTFLHKSGAWKTISVTNTTTTIASVSQGVLTLTSSVKENATLGMS